MRSFIALLAQYRYRLASLCH